MSDEALRKRIALANAKHCCSVCFAPLPVMSAEDEAKSRAEAYAQGMTDEQIDDPTYAAPICDSCWQRHGGLPAILAKRN